MGLNPKDAIDAAKARAQDMVDSAKERVHGVMDSGRDIAQDDLAKSSEIVGHAVDMAKGDPTGGAEEMATPISGIVKNSIVKGVEIVKGRAAERAPED